MLKHCFVGEQKYLKIINFRVWKLGQALHSLFYAQVNEGEVVRCMTLHSLFLLTLHRLCFVLDKTYLKVTLQCRREDFCSLH